jgi:very-short-patch-repair endonuclease
MQYHEIKAVSRQHRKNPTPAEYLLWQRIRKRQLKGRKFLRQHPVIYESNGNEHFFFIPDFYCASEKLIIELDGSIHDYQKEKDLRKEEILMQSGYRILRFRNEEINEMDNLLQKIENMFIPSPFSPP